MQDFLIWLENYKTENTQTLFLDFCLIRFWDAIFTADIYDVLNRYHYMETYKIASYSNIYDEIPNKFLDYVNIINAEIPKILKYKEDKNVK